MITQIRNCMNGARTLLGGQLASFSRLAYPCNQANEKKKKNIDNYVNCNNTIYIYICYRFIVRFPLGLDFLFITFILHFIL